MEKEFEKLTSVQEKIYKVLVETRDEALSLRDIGAEVEIKSPNTVSHHLKQLEKKGYISKDTVTGKIGIIKDPAKDIIYLNLYGGAAECGAMGFFAEDNVVERIPIPSREFKVGGNSFLIKAAGDSMEPHIFEGDLVVAERSDGDYKDGDILIVVHGDYAKIKRVFFQKEKILLVSLNSKYPPISIDNPDPDTISIAGIVRGVIHKIGKQFRV